MLDGEVPFIRIEAEGRLLKTKYSERDIPLCGLALAAMKRHPRGFARYADKGSNLSAALMKHFKQVKLLPTPKHSIYSFRHSFKNRLKSVEAPEELVVSRRRRPSRRMLRPSRRNARRCAFLKPPKTLTCPVCAFTPKPKCDVVNDAGELVEMSSQQWRIFYAKLRHIRDERGYKKGWAAVQYRSKFGSYPPWAWNDDPTATPTVTTLRWVRSRMIAYAQAVRAAS